MELMKADPGPITPGAVHVMQLLPGSCNEESLPLRERARSPDDPRQSNPGQDPPMQPMFGPEPSRTFCLKLSGEPEEEPAPAEGSRSPGSLEE